MVKTSKGWQQLQHRCLFMSTEICFMVKGCCWNYHNTQIVSHIHHGFINED